jgi:hypothetical protein
MNEYITKAEQILLAASSKIEDAFCPSKKIDQIYLNSWGMEIFYLADKERKSDVVVRWYEIKNKLPDLYDKIFA